MRPVQWHSGLGQSHSLAGQGDMDYESLNALIRSRKNTVSRFETRALRGRPHQVYLIVRQPCAAPLMRRASFVKPRTALACSMPHKQRVE